MKQDTTRSTDRRTFLSRLAAGCAGAAASSALAGCGTLGGKTELPEGAETREGTQRSETRRDQSPGVGIYLGNDRTLNAWENWFGRTVDYYSIALFRNSWEDYRVENWPLKIDLQSVFADRHPVITFSMFPDGAELEQVAAGEFAEKYRRLARELVDNGLSDAHLRFGAEFNGNWSPGTAVSRPELFVEAWKQVVRPMRSVSGAAFTFVWAPDIWKRQLAAPKAYPGDEWVDEVGLTFYDKGDCYPYPEQCDDGCRRRHRECTWERLLEGRDANFGLNFWADFAREHGKTLVFPEYGVMARNWSTPGGGDNPQFFRNFDSWMTENEDVVGWHNTWSWTSGPSYVGPARGHTSTEYPLFRDASATFRRLFGNPDAGSSS